ncbi:glycosyltransferase family 4 protein [Euzebya tangerina]|uniref:glycosyltransferase family 4 protein n=1 Tax=Euzebya tangerina TaxID=591198 RepID=UPI000E311725|nr:glycosyltransferase family 4 protein [Euzebya tangerina]
MKVALVCPYDWSKPGGVKAHVANLAEYLMARHEVRIFAPTSGRLAQDGVDALVEHVGRPVPIRYNSSVAPVGLGPRVIYRMKQRLMEYDPHITHIHEPLAPWVSMAATVAGPMPKIGTFHAWSDSDRIYRLTAPFIRKIVADLKVRVAVSPSAQTYASQAIKVPARSFEILPNGVDDVRFASAEAIPQLVDPDRPLLLFVGRLERRKGLETLIKAVLRLRADGQHLRLCVVGEGPERERCQSLVPPSLRTEVLFVGSVSHDVLPRYHASADVFVSPAHGGESFGIVLLEGMAAGLPVVASSIPGYRTVMTDGVQGRMVPPDDAVKLAEALRTLLVNPKLRAAMGAEGRRTASEFSWSVVGAKVEEMYHRVHRNFVAEQSQQPDS